MGLVEGLDSEGMGGVSKGCSYVGMGWVSKGMDGVSKGCS